VPPGVLARADEVIE